MWELGHKRPQHGKAQQANADKVAPKQDAATSAAPAETQTHIHPTEEGEGSGEEPVVPRGPEWVDERVRRPSSRTGPYSHRRSLVGSISDLHLAGDPSPVNSDTFNYGQRQQSRSSRRSSGRARTGSDPTTI